MSNRLDWSPLPALQPYHKVCDVTYNPDIKSEAVEAALCRTEPPDVSIRPSDAPPRLDGAEKTAVMEGLLKNCRIKNQLLRECLAEFLGVYVLIVSKETLKMLKSPFTLEMLLMIQSSNKCSHKF